MGLNNFSFNSSNHSNSFTSSVSANSSDSSISRMDNVELVCFDLWRTLIPATIDFQYLKNLSNQQNVSLSDFISRYEFATMRSSFSSIDEMYSAVISEFPNSSSSVLKKTFFEIYNNRVDLIKFYDDVLPTLSALKKSGFKLALVTNSEYSIKPLTLNSLPLEDFFDFFAWSFEVGSVKPDRKIFDFVLSEANVLPENSVMVGDSPNSDILGAVNVGMNAVLIDRVSRVEKPLPCVKISDLRELLPVLGVGDFIEK